MSISTVVALKFLLDTRAGRLRRFAREARAQARVQHETICPIYEVGRYRERPYIAMRFIDGVSLERESETMSLEEKLRVMAEVADGVHAANRNGLIHRDLKPSNIMIERDGDGWARPRVLDFGVAWLNEDTLVTADGGMLGTPAYMAPEQVMSKSIDLDRRTDVYGLGATLYALITGQPPFRADNAMRMMMMVMNRQPDSPRKLGFDIPAEVGLIIMKCLEKERSRRYASARELARDIRRYLEGDPIAAKPAGLPYRAGKWVRKNRVSSALTVVSLIVFLVFGAALIHTRLEAARQTEMALSFGREIEAMESRLRLAYLAPAHDASAERAEVRARMVEMADELEGLGRRARGPGRYALGRAALAVGSPHEALAHLEAAWDAGYRVDDVRIALGQAFLACYEETRTEVARIAAPEAREARAKAIDAAYRQPARALSHGLGDESLSGFLAAQLAVLEGDLGRGLSELGAAATGEPWTFEKALLRAEIRMLQARNAIDTGAYGEAFDHLAAARRGYEDTIDIARSAPDGYTGICELARTELELRQMVGEPLVAAFQRLERDCARIRQVAPDHPFVEEVPALAETIMARDAIGRGLDPKPHIERAVALAGSVLARAPRVSAYRAAGSAWVRLAEHFIGSGQDPGQAIDCALAAYGEAYAMTPGDADLPFSMGNAHLYQGRYLMQTGADSEPSLTAALARYREASSLNRSWARPYSNMGVIFISRADLASMRGDDPRPHLEQAVEALRAAVGLNANDVGALTNLANTAGSLGIARSERGEDASADFALAVDSADRAIEINPRAQTAHVNKARALMFGARMPSRSRAEALSQLARAEAALDHALEINGQDTLTHLLRGTCFQLGAELALDFGEDPREPADRAIEAFTRCLEINTGWFWALEGMGTVHMIVADYLGATGGDERAALEAALAALERSHALTAHAMQTVGLAAQARVRLARCDLDEGSDPEPQMAAARVWLARANGPVESELVAVARAELLVLEASTGREGGDPERIFEKAVAILRPFIESGEAHREARLTLAAIRTEQIRARQRSGLSYHGLVDEGLAALEVVLEARPEDATALASRARLLLYRGDDAAAADLFASAFALNPLLGYDYPDVAERLAGPVLPE